MTRPLMQHVIGQLEEMFAQGKGDQKVLKQLERELQYRQVPRALSLLAEVQAALYGGTLAKSPSAAAVPEETKLASASFKQLGPGLQSVISSTSPPAPNVQPRPALATSALPKPLAPLSTTVTMEEAYKLLRAMPASTWESIEQTRRLLVQQSHPSRVASLSAERGAEVRTEATRVNAAYLRLSAARCNR